MAVALRVTEILGDDQTVDVFGQLVFSGNYGTGGDTLTFDFATANTAGLSVYKQVADVPASQAPLDFSVQLDGTLVVDSTALTAVNVIPQAGSAFPKLKVFQNGSELSAGAYPAAFAVASAPGSTLRLRYKKNR